MSLKIDPARSGFHTQSLRLLPLSSPASCFARDDSEDPFPACLLALGGGLLSNGRETPKHLVLDTAPPMPSPPPPATSHAFGAGAGAVPGLPRAPPEPNAPRKWLGSLAAVRGGCANSPLPRSPCPSLSPREAGQSRRAARRFPCRVRGRGWGAPTPSPALLPSSAGAVCASAKVAFGERVQGPEAVQSSMLHPAPADGRRQRWQSLVEIGERKRRQQASCGPGTGC